MKSNYPTLESLDTMSFVELAALPAALLIELQNSLAVEKAALAVRTERFFEAERMRYGQAAHDALLASGKESGIVRINDGDHVVEIEHKISVAWDQSMLAVQWADLAMDGIDPRNFITRELKISETALKKWPIATRDAFLPARTIRAGKPTFKIVAPKGDGK